MQLAGLLSVNDSIREDKAQTTKGWTTSRSSFMMAMIIAPMKRRDYEPIRAPLAY